MLLTFLVLRPHQVLLDPLGSAQEHVHKLQIQHIRTRSRNTTMTITQHETADHVKSLQEASQQGWFLICLARSDSSNASLEAMIISATSWLLYLRAICSLVSQLLHPRWRNRVFDVIFRYIALSFQMPLLPDHCSYRTCSRSESRMIQKKAGLCALVKGTC